MRCALTDVPADLRYTADHEWASIIDETTVRVGVTDFAQNSLGDIVFVSVSGDEVAVGDTFGEVESTKSVSDLYAPVAGTIIRANPDLESSPELINSDPYGAGWIVEFRVADSATISTLLDAAAYQASIGD
jgi:glycine cleavage system H protein